MDLSQGVFHNNSKGIRQTPPFFTTSDCSGVGSDQEKKGEFRRRGGVTQSICFVAAEPLRLNRTAPLLLSASARRCVPSTAIQAKHGPLSTLARRVITPDWEQAERRISLFCYFSRSGLQSQSSRQTSSSSSSSSSSSLHTVVALQPVYSHTPRGDSDFWPLMGFGFFFYWNILLWNRRRTIKTHSD